MIVIKSLAYIIIIFTGTPCGQFAIYNLQYEYEYNVIIIYPTKP